MSASPRLKVRPSPGFTIVELLIVIVVIGILATLTIISYTGIQNQAHATALKSDLTQAAKTLDSYKFGTSGTERYPDSLSIAKLSATPGTNYTYQVNNTTNPASFCLSATRSSVSYRLTSTEPTPTEGTCSGVLAGGDSCPTGFIVVPGNPLFSTADFCVAKYEMKIAGNDNGTQTYSASFVPESRASGTPWVNISQTNALTEATTVASCTGCHLITENEWLTIAHNVLSVPSNWSSGTVGTGYIYSGHSDNAPANSLAADTNDSNGYTGTGQSGTSSQKRTLTLSNGEVIWDMAGNVYDWSSGTITGNAQPGLSGEVSYAIKQWNNTMLIMNGLPPSARPAYGTPAASGWTGSHGIGQLFSNYGETAARAFRRGGVWDNGSSFTGVFSLYLSGVPSTTNTYSGFRVSR